MKIQVNGELKSLDLGLKSLTLENLLKDLGHHPKTIVVEFNGTILSPNLWRKQTISEGDVLEIVTIVGGG